MGDNEEVTPTTTNQQSTDNGGQGEITSEQQQVVDEIKGHPAWQEILNELPEDFQHAIKPKLLEWDQGVQKKLQDVHSKYDPYKKFIENEVPSEALEQALAIMQAIESDPAGVAASMIEQFGLDFISKDDIELIDEDDDDEDDDDDDEVDITKHPEFKAMEETVKNIQTQFEKREQAEKQTQAEKQFEKLMSSLHENHGEFDEVVVTALMTTGMDGEKAVKQYQDTINQAAAKIAGSSNSTQEIPVVMGGSGTSGSGLPENPVSMGKLSKDDTAKLVLEMLNADQ